MAGRQWFVGLLVAAVVALGTVACTPPASYALVAVGGGARFNCAMYGNGRVWCWGADEVGELGRGSPGPSSPTPTAVGGLPSATRISAGIGDHECAVVVRGQLYCWGSNDSLQLGTMFFTSSATPLAVAGLPPVSFAATGKHHSCAVVTSSGAVKCWGSNTFGELGDGTTTQSANPVDVSGLTHAVTVTAGDGFTCALKTDDTVWCWGEDNSGQLGNGQSGPNVHSVVPVQVLDAAANPNGFGDPLTGITALSAGATHVCAVKGGLGNPAVWCWGTDAVGELGNAPNGPSSFAVPATGLVQTATRGVTTVQSGWYHTCADLVAIGSPSTSSVICWGGSPGNGATLQSGVSQPVPPLTGLGGVRGFSAGYDDTCALVTPGASQAGRLGGSGGQVYCWGRNNEDQLGATGGSTPVPQLVVSLPITI
jgi:alpha-tubulin suppressor-like RCC1 family protein